MQVSGRATLVSWTRVHQPFGAGFDHCLPYFVLLVELVEQPCLYMVSDAADDELDAENLRAGLPMQVAFLPLDEQWTLPQFRPAGARP